MPTNHNRSNDPNQPLTNQTTDKPQNKKAHEPGNEVTGLCFGPDGSSFYSRCTDGTLKIWDLRK
jgi:WD40 repeat protein